MLSIPLVGLAAAACSLPAIIDPNSACVEDANGFSTLDADSDDDIPIKLQISNYVFFCIINGFLSFGLVTIFLFFLVFPQVLQTVGPKSL